MDASSSHGSFSRQSASSSLHQHEAPVRRQPILMQAQTASLMVQHVYRVGLREEWMHEDEEDCEVVFLQLAQADGGATPRNVCYPAGSTGSQMAATLAAELDAKTVVISKSSSAAALLQQYPLESSILLDTGEQIPILLDLAEAGQLSKGSGCFLLRHDNLAICYGSTQEAITLPRQLDLALSSALFRLATAAVEVEALETINVASRSIQRASQSGGFTPSSSGYEADPSRMPGYYRPDPQQLQWLESLKPREVVSDKNGGTGADDKAGGDDDDDDVDSEAKQREPAPVLTTDVETGETILEDERKPIYTSSMLVGLAWAVNLSINGLFVRDVVLNFLYDRDFLLLILLGIVPLRLFVSQFFCEHVIIVLAQTFFPIAQMHRNSLYYSGKKSRPLPKGYALPHFTIQMPCYKEGLKSVLVPSLTSVQAAVDAYRAIGGTANVVISEDGLRLLDQHDAAERIKYFNSIGAGWVARPPNGQDGYERRGRFKKASNLNFTYSLSLEVEEVLQELVQRGQHPEPTEALYAEALEAVLEKRNGKAWASGDIRMGDYLLLIDSDTRVPVDCLLDAAAELERSPDVGALQHCSGITYVQHHYFERLFGYFVGVFTNFSISWNCASGAMAPLMGHNVFLRWSALQQVAHKTDKQGEVGVFSADHVSEDYELAMRLQMAGYCVRWATYSNQEFREGVSLNPNDEKARWQKYAFGACELVINPLWKWFMGPVAPFYWRFLFSRRVNFSAKLASLSYLSSYFAIAVSLPITLGITVVQGLFWPTLDTTFKAAFDTWVAVIVVFNLAGALGLVICRTRSGHAGFLAAIWESFQHLPAIVVFFSGIAYHVMCSVLAFLFSVNMTWGATSKDFEQASIREVVKRFWHCYAVMGTLLLGLIFWMTPLVPMEWRLEGAILVMPLFLAIAMHILFPILLDPGILHKFLPRYYAKQANQVEQTHDFFSLAKGDDKAHHHQQQQQYGGGLDKRSSKRSTLASHHRMASGTLPILPHSSSGLSTASSVSGGSAASYKSPQFGSPVSTPAMTAWVPTNGYFAMPPPNWRHLSMASTRPVSAAAGVGAVATATPISTSASTPAALSLRHGV